MASYQSENSEEWKQSNDAKRSSGPKLAVPKVSKGAGASGGLSPAAVTVRSISKSSGGTPGSAGRGRANSLDSDGSADPGSRRPRSQSKTSVSSQRSVRSTRSTRSTLSNASNVSLSSRPSREEGYQARIRLLNIIKAFPVIRELLGLPAHTKRLEVLHALERSDEAELVLRMAGLDSQLYNEALDLLDIGGEAPAPLKRVCTRSRLRLFVDFFLCCLGIIFVAIGGSSVPRSQADWSLGSCRLASFTNQSCAAGGSSCALNVFVFTEAGEVLMYRNFFPSVKDTYYDGLTWVHPAFRCCPMFSCCGIFDSDTKTYCDEWSHRTVDGTPGGERCQAGQWSCLYKHKMEGNAKGDYKVVTDMKEYEEPASTVYIVCGTLLLVFAFCDALWVRFFQSALKSRNGGVAPEPMQSPKSAWVDKWITTGLP
eukprot:TRINITY_DN48139_c0_g1_i1.p1 TRINITY_DN48139_c0_g1~~TRINITY_DN48139_c0_g1_i1.p1  ORF type:complete len:426 (-),score=80.12 TRINITY_DN48139_c0_g1_i1:58-1335(-)